MLTGHRYFWPQLSVLIVIGLSLRFLSAGFGGPIANDAAAFYLPNAQAILDGGWRNWDAMTIAIPPLFPLVVAWLYPLTGDLEYAALAISIIASTLIAWPVYGIAKQLFPSQPAIWKLSTWFALLHPFLIRYGGDAKADSFYAFLFVSAVWFALLHLKSPRLWVGAGFGLLTGLAYLVRPEALGLLILVPLVGTARFLGKDRDWSYYRRGIIGYLAALLLVAPSLAWNASFVHAKVGVWTLSPKAGGLQEYDKGLGDPLNRLNESRTMILHEEKLSSREHYESFSMLDLLLEQPIPLLRAFTINLYEYVRTFPKSLGIWTGVLFLLGLIFMRGSMDRPTFWTIVGMIVLYGFSFSIFYVSRRFWLPLMPALIPICGAGAFYLLLRLSDRLRRPELVLVLVSIFLLSPEALASGARNDWDWFSSPEKRLGQRLREEFGSGCRFVSAKGRVAFYADGTNLGLPSDPLEAVVDYMENRDCDFLVVDLRRAQKRREDLYRELQRTPRLELAMETKGNDWQIGVYRIRKEPGASREVQNK